MSKLLALMYIFINLFSEVFICNGISVTLLMLKCERLVFTRRKDQPCVCVIKIDPLPRYANKILLQTTTGCLNMYAQYACRYILDS